MPDYQKGKIYKLISMSHNKDIYIGSTIKHYLCDRFQKHKHNYKKNESCSSKNIIEYGDAQIVLIENYPCDSKDELHARETYQIQEHKKQGFNVVNSYSPYRTDEGKKELKACTDKAYREKQGDILKQKKKDYAEANKDAIAEQRKKFREANVEVIKQRKKDHYEANKEAIREKHKLYADSHKEQKKIQDKAYYEANKQKASNYGKLKFMCSCGIEIKNSNKSQHLKSDKHKLIT